MRTDETRGARFDLALERLQEGHAIVVQGVGYHLRPGGSVEVAAFSDWAPENLDELMARSKIRHAQLLYERLHDESEAFREIVGRCQSVRFVLVWDYGNGSVELAELRGDAFIWSPGVAHS